ncbi:glycosyltransferase [Candidatus Thioglobus sp.]|nr:glycosyltransferase [Candidatus Thioglobus sp.]
MNKNICLVHGAMSGNGGGERVVISLAQALSKLDCKVTVIVLDEQKINLPFDDSNFKIWYIKKPKQSGNLLKFTHTARQSKLLRQKIIETGVSFDLFISHSVYDATICKRLKLPNVYYAIHGAIGIQHSLNTGFAKFKQQAEYSPASILKFIIRIFFYKWFVVNLYSNESLIVDSHGIKQDLLKFGIQPKSIQTIYNPFDFNNIRQQSVEYSVSESDYIIHVGRFDAIKRHDILIKAYKQSGIKQKLLLLGDDSGPIGQNLHKLVLDLGLENGVIFKGFTSNPFPYIKNAQALILSSDSEGFGLVLGEALVLNTPVVSTDCVSGPSEILTDELKPFLSPVGDIEALAKNIKKMINNQVEITDKYIDRFSAEKIAKQYLSLCD